MMTHKMIKQSLALFITILYLVNSFSDNKYNKYFSNLALLFGLMFPILLIINIPLNFFILNSWSRTTTYFIYYCAFIIYYLLLKSKGFDSSYSLTMGINAITASGYLYEVPRFYNLVGLKGLIRYHRPYYDYGMISTVILILLIIKVGYKKPSNLISSLVGYFSYLISYYNPILYDTRTFIGLSYYRMIVLTLLLVLIDGVKK